MTYWTLDRWYVTSTITLNYFVLICCSVLWLYMMVSYAGDCVCISEYIQYFSFHILEVEKQNQQLDTGHCNIKTSTHNARCCCSCRLFIPVIGCPQQHTMHNNDRINKTRETKNILHVKMKDCNMSCLNYFYLFWYNRTLLPHSRPKSLPWRRGNIQYRKPVLLCCIPWIRCRPSRRSSCLSILVFPFLSSAGRLCVWVSRADCVSVCVSMKWFTGNQTGCHIARW